MASGPRPLSLTTTPEDRATPARFTVLRGAAADRTLSAHAFRFDPFDAGLLALLRYLALAMAEPAGPAWRGALTVAEERWPGRGGRVTLDLMAVLDTLPRALGRAYRSTDPLDMESRAYMTADEDALVRAIAAMRRDDTPRARREIARLTGGRMDPDLIRTALAFSTAHRIVKVTHAAQAQTRPPRALLH